MRLYLAVAVLMLAFVAYTEAQEETVDQRLSAFGDKLTEFGRSIADKAKTTFQDIHNSEFGTNARNWFKDAFEKMKAKVGELSQ
ncbi:apolipoprotein C-I [Archocentrus centrarchus]|uniref:apolipoprotein C-I n=1 Tax=Archocentrus centrarchus TaxID=63155 RepID=UPI0011EA1268|nr:apolipoprotein C-I [Archocentrus centrarchus]